MEDGAGGPRVRPRPALVLNASMEPLSVVSARRAVVLVLADKVEAVHHDGVVFRSESLAMRAPSVVRLQRQVHIRQRPRAGLSRRAVMLRDRYRCQYCGRPAEDVDHVLPRSRGGPHTWENVVAACRTCNARKQDHTPAEAGLRLAARPKAPPAVFWLVVRARSVDTDWKPYLAPYLGSGWSGVLDLLDRPPDA